MFRYELNMGMPLRARDKKTVHDVEIDSPIKKKARTQVSVKNVILTAF